VRLESARSPRRDHPNSRQLPEPNHSPAPLALLTVHRTPSGSATPSAIASPVGFPTSSRIAAAKRSALRLKIPHQRRTMINRSRIGVPAQPRCARAARTTTAATSIGLVVGKRANSAPVAEFRAIRASGSTGPGVGSPILRSRGIAFILLF